MEGMGELVSWLVGLMFTFLMIVFFVTTLQLGLDYYHGYVIVQGLNRYEQIETDMDTQFDNTNVTTASDGTQMSYLLANNDLPKSDLLSVDSVLTSAGVPYTNRQDISTTVCYLFPVLIAPSSPIKACLSASGLREAP